jgi:23S rRNA (guanosine2251-2'-O)-methyltransferase
MNNYPQKVYGLHAVLALLQKQPKRVIRIFVLKQREDSKIALPLQLAAKLGVPIEYSTKQELDILTESGNHQGILAYCIKAQTYTEHDLSFLLQGLSLPPFILVLDGVQDPHNLGACFRSAEAAGVDVIIAPKDKSVGLTPVVSKVASGAVETLPFVQATNLARTLKMLKDWGIWIYGAAGEAQQSLYQTNLTGPIAIVLGAEGTGLRRLTREHCDYLIRIPLRGTVTSLNVSVAAGVFMFEALRQRQDI